MLTKNLEKKNFKYRFLNSQTQQKCQIAKTKMQSVSLAIRISILVRSSFPEVMMSEAKFSMY